MGVEGAVTSRRTDVFTKLVVLPATILISVFLVLYVGIDETILLGP